jgi:hypothetical protein
MQVYSALVNTTSHATHQQIQGDNAFIKKLLIQETPALHQGLCFV